MELELEFYLFDRQIQNIGEIISKCEIILSGDYHKGHWPDLVITRSTCNAIHKLTPCDGVSDKHTCI